MTAHARLERLSLLGIGIYSPADAGRLTHVPATRIRRWLCGHRIDDRHYRELWAAQIDIDDGDIYLGFRDLIEVRVVNALIEAGLSAQKVRRAIDIARDRYGIDRPLSTRRFRTDGKHVFLLLADEGQDRTVDLFRDQFAIRQVLEPSFKGLEFDEEGMPARWRIDQGVLVDPAYSFGQPIEQETLVPTRVLAAAAAAEGSGAAAAQAFVVPLRAVNRAVAFEQSIARRQAA
ncbi:MAG: hypothetical protein RIB84_20850 [Sneathiellaceae bacterium]